MSETVWKDDGLGIVEAGQVGGDVQVGEAYARRFVHSRLAGRHIEVRCYPVREDDLGDPDTPGIRLEVQTELMVATDPDDPDGSKVWSDLEYSDLPESYDRDFATVEAAQLAAMLYLKQLDPALHFTWDGRPEMGPASELKYGDMLRKMAVPFDVVRTEQPMDVISYVQGVAIDSNTHPSRSIRLDWWTETVTDAQGDKWRVAWLMDATRCLRINDEDQEGGWVFAVYWEPFAPTHTHYHPTRPPCQVPGRLVDCDRPVAHDAHDSELWADYRYNPQLLPSAVTGLPAHLERDLLAAYMDRRAKDTVYAITDVTVDETYTYLVEVTNRTAYALNEAGPLWHTETWGLDAERGWCAIPVNPHPPYEHIGPHCPNCGH